MAGLLTDSHLEYLPDNCQWQKFLIKMFYRAPQQRDCPGFTPDSLLITVIVEQQ